MGAFFNTILINPIINALLVIYHMLAAIHMPYALGFSIIVLTLLIRLLLSPLTGAQMRSTRKMQSLSPKLNALKEKHKGDATQLQQATMALYKEHGVNPLGGCVPALIQLPLTIALYNVLRMIVTLNSHDALTKINHVAYTKSLGLAKLWDTTFFGLPLGKTIPQLLHQYGYLLILIPVLTAGLQFIQSKMMVAMQPKPAPVKPGEKKPDDFATAFQSQSLFIFPLMIGYLSFQFPLGLSLYWNSFTIFGIIQQYFLNKEVKHV
jgi:YidC/Oxa1 family membrane protein insertase